MNGHHFIEIAGMLVANSMGNSAARNRTAISRAYYGVFHCALEFLAQFDVSIPSNPNSHQQTYVKLFQTGIPQAQEAANLLNDLRGERNRADYDLDKPAPEHKANARSCVESAHDFCSCVEECLQEPIRSQLEELFSWIHRNELSQASERDHRIRRIAKSSDCKPSLILAQDKFPTGG
jgi:uncharacterized protein (UPF0332 family)